MRKEMVAQVVELTRQCLEHYWQGDAEFVLSRCVEDVVWIASAQSQFLEGIQQVREDCRMAMPHLQRCHLLGQEFIVIQNTGNACTIAGRYLTTTDASEDYFLQVQQRCTFVWELVKGELVIRHLHVSNPMGELKIDPGTTVVREMGYMAREYMMRHYRQQVEMRRIMVPDRKEGVTHFLAPAEIVSAAADRRFCIIQTAKGESIDARMSIAEFSQAAGAGFMAVHRSYVLNVDYITQIRPYCAVLADGQEVPIPVKKFREVREKLAVHYNTPCEEK